MKREREMEREGERERGVLCKGEAGRLNIADSLGWWGRGGGGVPLLRLHAPHIPSFIAVGIPLFGAVSLSPNRRRKKMKLNEEET